MLLPSIAGSALLWKNAYSENTSRKVWAAKFVARHPNLVAMELSNFKCGHDAPIYTVVEEIVEQSGTPYFCFKDLDENKPAGSIKLRIETIDYFLERYRAEFVAKREKREQIQKQLGSFEARLRILSRRAGPESTQSNSARGGRTYSGVCAGGQATAQAVFATAEGPVFICQINRI